MPTVAEWQQAGGDVDAPFRFEDWNALQLMAAEGNELGVEALLTAGARVDFHVDSNIAGLPWHTPLHIASRYGHSAVVRLLASRGADVNTADCVGFTPLDYAASNGHSRTVEALLELGASLPKVTHHSQLTLRALPRWDYTRLALVKRKPGEVNAVDLAEAAGHHEVVQLLNRRVVWSQDGASAATSDSISQLKEWLERLDCSSLLPQFLQAGYDYGFIKQHGLHEDDLDAIGVPRAKLGLRKKLAALYAFPQSQPLSTKGGLKSDASSLSDSENEDDSDHAEGDSDSDQSEDSGSRHSEDGDSDRNDSDSSSEHSDASDSYPGSGSTSSGEE